MAFTQWAYSEDLAAYRAIPDTVPGLPPGYYKLITDSNNRVHFCPVPPRDDELLQFPDSASEDVISGIADFWNREHIFRRYGLPFKRGILLHGPAGTGKTSALQIIAREVIARSGIVLTYEPRLFSSGYRHLRAIQPGTPLVVFIEDIELYETLESIANTSTFLNMLDGAENIDKVVFLATTNHPEKLSARIINRPSRFDMIIEVPYPSAEMRRLYISSLAEDSIDIERYVQDTEGLSLAHVKELFVATVILGAGYTESVARLKAMHLTIPYKPSDTPSANGLQGVGNYM